MGLALGMALTACGGGGDGLQPVLAVDDSGVSTVVTESMMASLSTYPTSPLSGAEAASLAFMRQEEQLAHDVYVTSAARWPQPLFGNIALAEATHSAAVKTLLDRYQQADPLAGLAAGVFPAPEFQRLYDRLVAASAVSLVTALQVGLEIEELDIRDIAVQRPAIDNADILMVYDNLARGSRNHLRAFWKVLRLQGGTYVPKYISQAEFDAIVSTPVETGG